MSTNIVNIISEIELETIIATNTPYFGYVCSTANELWYVTSELSTACDVDVDMGTMSHYTFPTQWAYNIYDASEDKEYIAYLSERDRIKISFGLVGQELSYLGNNNQGTRAKTAGAKKGTSVASMVFRQQFGEKNTPRLLRKITPKRIGIPYTKAYIPTNNSKLGPYLGRQIPVAGAAFLAVGVVQSGYSIHESDNKPKAVTREVGGWAGAYAGGWVGAESGAIIGASIGAMIGAPAAGVVAAPAAVMGGIIGGFVGGVAGSIGGYYTGSNAAEMTYEVIMNE